MPVFIGHYFTHFEPNYLIIKKKVIIFAYPTDKWLIKWLFRYKWGLVKDI